MSFRIPTLPTMLVPAALFHKLDMCSAADVIKQRPNVDSIVVGWDMQLTALKVVPWMNSKQTHTDTQHSGQIIATSHDLTPNGGLVREIPLFQENLGW